MFSSINLGIRYIFYYLTASSGKGHGVHSPFVFDFITKVLNDERSFYAFAAIENLRADLLKDSSEIDVEDFGAGSRLRKINKRSVQAIAQSSLKPKKFGQLFFRMVNYYTPQNILELGTSLGITSAYLASANTNIKLTTLEGASTISKIAISNFKHLQLENIQLVTGNFDETLKDVLANYSKIDFVFVDGNHRFEPTLRYFHDLLPLTHDQTILIFDDIHWSREMEKAWKEIQDYPAVTLTIDLFFIGIVIFRKENKVKQHFTIRY
jgi:predicted O-methyltransferase YrrM